MIKAVIFDLDNTLYNFDAANEFGIRALAAYTEPVFGWDYPKMKDLYEESREKLTERMGDVGSAHNRLLRFQNLLEEKKLPLHPHALEMAKVYWRGVLDNMVPAPGVREMMKELRGMGIRIGLGTDMTAYVQYEKMIRLGLLEYMDFIVSSEEAGTDKPGNAFFMLCARKAGCLPGVSATISSAIMAAHQRPACRRAGLSRLGNKRIIYVILKLLLPISPAWHSLVWHKPVLHKLVLHKSVLQSPVQCIPA